MPERPATDELIRADPAYPIFSILADLIDCGYVYDVIRSKPAAKYAKWTDLMRTPQAVDLTQLIIAAVNPHNATSGFTVRGNRADVATITPLNGQFELDRWDIHLGGVNESYPFTRVGHEVMETLVHHLGF